MKPSVVPGVLGFDMPDMNVFFDTKEQVIADLVMPNGRGKYTGQTHAEIVATRPTVVEVTWKEAEGLRAANAIKGPVQITEEKFFEALEVLPPMNWRNRGFSESFRVSEEITGGVYWAYVRLGKRHFELAQPITMNHAQLVVLVVAEFGEEA